MTCRIVTTECGDDGMPLCNYASIDWKDGADTIAEKLNALLVEHKAEIVMHDTDCDQHIFSVRKL